ncbi:MAG: hypothetical protein WA667_10960 [Candidatus Nitrosopolaris sp.]
MIPALEEELHKCDLCAVFKAKSDFYWDWACIECHESLIKQDNSLCPLCGKYSENSVKFPNIQFVCKECHRNKVKIWRAKPHKTRIKQQKELLMIKQESPHPLGVG